MFNIDEIISHSGSAVRLTEALSSRRLSQSSKTSCNVRAGRCSDKIANRAGPRWGNESLTARTLNKFGCCTFIRRWISASSCASFFLPGYEHIGREHREKGRDSYLGNRHSIRNRTRSYGLPEEAWHGHHHTKDQRGMSHPNTL